MLTPAGSRSRRALRLPRAFPRRPLAEPLSSARAGFFGSARFYLRVGVLAAVTVGLFSVLTLRLWSLEILQGKRYAHAATQQTFRYLDFPAPRGLIVDAHGRLLAGVSGQLQLTADPSALGLVGRNGRWRPTGRGWRLLRRAARVTGVPASRFSRRIARGWIKAPYAPAVLVRNLARPLAFYVEERAARYPGMSVTAVTERSYPQRALGSEFLGLLGEIGAPELKQSRFHGYGAGEVVGQSGVEAYYDRVLNRGFQRARLAVDSAGDPAGPLRPLPLRRRARTLELTIDARLQRAAERAIRDGIGFAHAAGHLDASAGAAVVMNPRTGALYALASYPSFDQSASARDPQYLAHLLDPRNAEVPLLDRATQGLYPAGSTFKPFVAEAALSAGLISPYSTLPCTGSLTVGNVVFHNVEAGINASLTLPQALSISCDTWFYRLGTAFYARQLASGSLDMQRWASRLGLGRRTGLDLPGEAAGVVPTPAWLRRTFSKPWERIWYEGYSVNLSIGQGYLALTPLQLAVGYAAFANDGTVVTPHVAKAVLDPDGRLVRALRFPRRRVRLVDDWAIRQGLFDAAHSSTGTSSSVFGSFPVSVAGKTGTAEAPPGSDHSWYASWAPASNPRVVVVVLIEHGGFGVEAAAPAAREIYSTFFHLHG